MAKKFNVNGVCRPDLHYMVDLSSRLAVIRKMVEEGAYFTINKARQYGKTTILRALAHFLQGEYEVVSLDFQRMSSLSFKDEQMFVASFSEELLYTIKNIPEEIESRLCAFADGTARLNSLQSLFRVLSMWCASTEKPIILIIDEVDTATNNQVFVDFLAQLRAYYLSRDQLPTFQSVILAGVYDVRNMKRKLRDDEEHKQNSPWNIAADFDVEMSFSVEDIAGMLREYEADYHTGMKVSEQASLLYDYTSGYPFLVSRLCKLMDEQLAGTDQFPDKSAAWTKQGVLEAVKILLAEKNALFESLIGKLNDYPDLKSLICRLLFQGQTIAYNADDPATDMLLMFGFVKVEQGTLQIANRIFETRLYNYFLTLPEVQNGEMYRLALWNKNQFIKDGKLDMEHLLEKFVEHFDDIYGDRDEKFLEEDGRRYFMLYLKPIINGVGNYYVESRTRNQERTDLIVDYLGEQFVIEMKIWRGNIYHERGEKQLAEYLSHYHLDKGYMLCFNFNRKKKSGLTKVQVNDKIIVEAIV